MGIGEKEPAEFADGRVWGLCQWCFWGGDSPVSKSRPGAPGISLGTLGRGLRFSELAALRAIASWQVSGRGGWMGWKWGLGVG